MKGTAIVVYLVLATQSHIPLTPQQIISNYETGTNLTMPKSDYIIKIDAKGCQDVFAHPTPTKKNPRITSEIMIYQFCSSNK